MKIYSSPRKSFSLKTIVLIKSFVSKLRITSLLAQLKTIKPSPTLFPINETFTSRDYIAEAATIDYEPIEDCNLNTILANLAITNLRNDRIRTFLDSQTNISSTSSSDFQLSNIAHYLYNSFLILISSTFWPIFSNALISLTWSLILTIFTLIHIYKKLKLSFTPFLIVEWQILRKRLRGKEIANVAVKEAIESDRENELVKQNIEMFSS